MKETQSRQQNKHVFVAYTIKNGLKTFNIKNI